MRERKKINIIAVDFDGTLCSDCYPEIGVPNLPLIHLLQQLKEQDKKLILWTCRCGEKLNEAVEWCRRFGLEFDAVNENVAQIIEIYGTESRKVSADVYIDDKACFPWQTEKEWEKTGENKEENPLRLQWQSHFPSENKEENPLRLQWQSHFPSENKED